MTDDTGDRECVCIGLSKDEWKSLLTVVKETARREFREEHPETAEAIREIGKKVFEQTRKE